MVFLRDRENDWNKWYGQGVHNIWQDGKRDVNINMKCVIGVVRIYKLDIERRYCLRMNSQRSQPYKNIGNFLWSCKAIGYSFSSCYFLFIFIFSLIVV
jgi:hypothetical protein